MLSAEDLQLNGPFYATYKNNKLVYLGRLLKRGRGHSKVLQAFSTFDNILIFEKLSGPLYILRSEQHDQMFIDVTPSWCEQCEECIDIWCCFDISPVIDENTPLYYSR